MQRPKADAARFASLTMAAGLALGLAPTTGLADDRLAPNTANTGANDTLVRYATETIDDLDIFYREAGSPSDDAPTVVLLHGFPTSSHMFRDLIPDLADRYHVIAPDYPGYGLSSAPPAEEYDYTFDNAAALVEELLDRKGAEQWVLYLQDYGAPVGFRLAVNNPNQVAGLIIQNGNAYQSVEKATATEFPLHFQPDSVAKSRLWGANSPFAFGAMCSSTDCYEEGLPDSFWGPWRDYWADDTDQEAIDYLAGLLTLESTIWQFKHGTRNPDAISPDNWLVVQPLLDRPGNAHVQLEYAYDYGSNLGRYPTWQRYLRDNQPPTIITWGRHDQIFPSSGAFPYLRDLPNAELHLLDTGHFALEEDGDRIASLIREFMDNRVIPSRGATR